MGMKLSKRAPTGGTSSLSGARTEVAEISVTSPDGETLMISIDLGASTAQLKLQISEHSGIPSDNVDVFAPGADAALCSSKSLRGEILLVVLW